MILLTAVLVTDSPKLDPPGLSAAGKALTVFATILVATGSALVLRGMGVPWTAVGTAVLGLALVALAFVSDRLGLGSGGGFGAKQVALVIAGGGLSLWALRDRVRTALVSVPAVVWGVFAVGVALRAWFMISYRPGFLGFPDAGSYAIFANTQLFGTPYRPAGESAFLRVLNHLSGELSFSVAAHHILGVGTAVLLYCACVRLGSSRRLAALPAGVVLLSGTQVFLEHSTLSEPLFTFLVAAAVYAVARGRAEGLPWLAGAGCLLALAGVTRSPGVLLVPVFAGWLLADSQQPLRARVMRAGTPVVTAAVLLGGYLAVHANVTGHWGFTRAQNETLYARVAPIAKCSEFKPPSGTKRLCQRTPLAERPAANTYMFNPKRSPALRAFGPPPELTTRAPHDAFRYPADEELGRFARAVLRNQPLDYAESILIGMANYVTPSRVGPRSAYDWDTGTLVDVVRDTSFEDRSITVLSTFYETKGYLRRNEEGLDSYARLAKVEGIPTALLLILSLGGLVRRSRARLGAALMLSVALALMVSAVALLYYDARYATPAYGFLAAASALGLTSILPGNRGDPREGSEAARKPGV